MPTLIATPGALDANSYCSVSDGDLYCDTILNAADWADASSDDRARALIQGTRLLDEICEWRGAPSSQTQALKWPRRGVLTQVSANGGGMLFHRQSIQIYGGLLNPIGVELPDDAIPAFLTHATVEAGRSLLTSDRVSEQDSGNISSIEIPGLTIGYLGSGSSSKRKLLAPHIYQMIAFYALSVMGYTPRRVIRS